MSKNLFEGILQNYVARVSETFNNAINALNSAASNIDIFFLPMLQEDLKIPLNAKKVSETSETLEDGKLKVTKVFEAPGFTCTTVHIQEPVDEEVKELLSLVTELRQNSSMSEEEREAKTARVKELYAKRYPKPKTSDEEE